MKHEQTDHDPIVRIDSGDIRGTKTHGIQVFKGVPYAAPPVGPRRFAAPQPVIPWQGTRNATAPGPSAPQQVAPFKALDLPPIVGDGWTRGEDFLTLNVWAPDAPPQPDRLRPVMVWVHGGSFMIGTKDAPVYDGSAFARSGVVCVAMNYRLGVEGFLPIPGAPTNLGLRDMIAALQWVQANIAAFGGDPDAVTLFGESAGGMAVSCLLASPLAETLFQRAIVQSGHGSAVYPVEIGHRAVNKIASYLKVTPDVEGFRSASPEQALAAFTKAARPGRVDLRDERGHDPLIGLSLSFPVYGDDVLPLHPLAALDQGTGKDVDLLIGTTAEEARFWFEATPLRRLPHSLARWLLRRVTPNADALLDAYAAELPDHSRHEQFTQAITDLTFRWPARQFAAAHRGNTHVFEFDWRSPALNGRLGAAHGIDLAFTFDTLAVATGTKGMLGENPPQDLADHMHGLWVRYATDGTLPWAQFTPDSRLVYQFTARTAAPEAALPVGLFLPDMR
ncbi:carboxylesterase family protein [Streptomyces sp. SRF1]|uniref:carboxylesterase/lipase family protein n=1 Tax=Streptomyces sp. SRF1 TaxID=1549642 RepID=UPI0025B1CFFF|nr:carboxylesterase family protein [Streptomyces sp. SRF1]MDN3059746.1 carboxylesterase family protein [Streptomyces sp. SRF1]